MSKNQFFRMGAALSLAALVGACGSAGDEILPEKLAASPVVDAGIDTLPTPDPIPQQVESNVPMTRLAPGETPPQFVLFSFDGVGLTPNWDMFLDTAERVDARFTALMTGLYFLTDDNAEHYQGPGHAPGKAAIAFGGTEAGVLEQVRYLNRTWLAGHEMGTHYVGHFCKGAGYHGDQWTSADWTHELDQFFSLMENWKANNAVAEGPDLMFGREEVRGGRTQCLEGSLDQLIPAWHSFGMRWDSSMPAEQTGIVWPTEIDGIWEFPIPYVYSPALDAHQTALDYNFWYTLNGAREEPHTTRRAAEITTQSYEFMFREAYHGNRAPLVIANHFNDWNGNAFNPATAEFMADVCGLPDTYCATYSDVVTWMELQDPVLLAEWQSRPAVAVGPPGV
ncbi:polysaccharide deacetylase [Rhodococcus yananensis]|uniref:polysaccharide deacetylase n=1 Tax=Rhodococcus yananensis TaxID=2879464 RepID=UPI001CF8A8CE|nr:polysaccharide deacetylase [Rhodococcus yananensis]